MEKRDSIFSNTITLEDAKARTKLWRDIFTEVMEITEPAKIVRGFRIPIQDIRDLAGRFGETEIDYVRVYLSARPNTSSVEGEPYLFDILLVPVGTDDKDILSQRSGDLVLSTIFDVTQPCPPCCDTASDLYGAS